MKENIEKIYKAKTPTELIELANQFTRIANVEKGKWLDSLVNAEGKEAIPIGFVNRLLRYARMRRHFLDKEKSRLRAGLYKSLMRYDIARNLEKHPEKKTFEEMAGDEYWMDHLEFPASYALYRNRK